MDSLHDNHTAIKSAITAVAQALAPGQSDSICMDMEGLRRRPAVIDAGRSSGRGGQPRLYLFDAVKVPGFHSIRAERTDGERSMAQIIEDPNIVKVFHDARQDSIVLEKNKMGRIVKRFDTSIAHEILTGEARRVSRMC